jgi:hypothetical protein
MSLTQIAPKSRIGVTLGEILAEDPLAQWKAFYSLLVSAVPGLQGNEQYAFQFTNPERGADWWQEGQTSSLINLIDSKPVTGAFYGPGVSNTSDNYDLFLNAIDNEDDTSLKLARERFNKALEDDALKMGMEGDLKKDLESWRRGEGNPLDVTITKSTKLDNQWNLVAGGDVEVLGFNISGSGEVLDKTLVDDKYALKINYAAMRAYPLTRGRNWWNGGLISIYNSDATTFKTPYTRARFFDGKSGLLALIPSSVVVGYKYSVSLTISYTNYKEYKLDIEGKGGIAIGPFKLNANVAYKQTDIDEASNSATITYAGLSQDPVNFGVFSAINLMS